MEPAELNSAPDDPLDRLLRETRPPTLTDDGFSPRVLSALPPRARAYRPIAWTRPTAIVAGAIAGLLLLWNHGRTAAGVDAAVAEALAQLCQPQVGLALGAAAATVLFVYAPRLRRLLQL